jgi:hypothetical protein
MSFPEYLASIERDLRSGRATERTFYPALKHLMEAQGDDVLATTEPARIQAGAPDFAITRGEATIGYIEAKDPGTSLDEVERSEQLRRYRPALGNLILTDFLEFRWYVEADVPWSTAACTSTRPSTSRTSPRRRGSSTSAATKCARSGSKTGAGAASPSTTSVTTSRSCSPSTGRWPSWRRLTPPSPSGRSLDT